jgi:hypothetical protein
MRLYHYAQDARYKCADPSPTRLTHAVGLLDDVKREAEAEIDRATPEDDI